MQGDSAKSTELARATLNLFEEIGDQAGIIASKVALSLCLGQSGDVPKGINLAEETLLLCREYGDRFHEAQLLDSILGDAAIRQGDYARAIVLREHALELRRALGDVDGQAWSLFMLAGTVRAIGDMPRAQTLYEESTALWRQLGSWRWYADVLDELGRVICNQGNYSRAKALFEESLTAAQSIYDQ